MLPQSYLIIIVSSTLLLMVVILMVVLLTALLRTNKDQTLLLTNLLLAEQSRNQSLLNQLRSGDPMTLHALQNATNLTDSHSEEQYVPTHDEAAIYYSDTLPNSEYEVQGLSDDLDAAGWDHVTVKSGGNPVRFDSQDS